MRVHAAPLDDNLAFDLAFDLDFDFVAATFAAGDVTVLLNP